MLELKLPENDYILKYLTRLFLPTTVLEARIVRLALKALKTEQLYVEFSSELPEDVSRISNHHSRFLSPNPLTLQSYSPGPPYSQAPTQG